MAGAVILGEPRAAAAAAARRLGLHYLQRYFFLIAFRCASAQAKRRLALRPWCRTHQPARSAPAAPAACGAAQGPFQQPRPAPAAPPRPTPAGRTWTAPAVAARAPCWPPPSQSGSWSGASSSSCCPSWLWSEAGPPGHSWRVQLHLGRGVPWQPACTRGIEGPTRPGFPLYTTLPVSRASSAAFCGDSPMHHTRRNNPVSTMPSAYSCCTCRSLMWKHSNMHPPLPITRTLSFCTHPLTCASPIPCIAGCPCCPCPPTEPSCKASALFV